MTTASRACSLLLPAADSVRRRVEDDVAAERGNDALPLRATPFAPRWPGADRGGTRSYDSTGPREQSQPEDMLKPDDHHLPVLLMKSAKSPMESRSTRASLG